jgi:energy-converting hydrogenase Eha subunit C
MDQISILFKEYDTLRAEILTRTNNGYQLMTVMAGALAWLLSRPVNRMFFVSLTVVGLLLVLFVAALWRDIHMISARLQELEHDINELAGKELLRWETRWSGGPLGWIWRHPSMAKRNSLTHTSGQ